MKRTGENKKRLCSVWWGGETPWVGDNYNYITTTYIHSAMIMGGTSYVEVHWSSYKTLVDFYQTTVDAVRTSNLTQSYKQLQWKQSKYNEKPKITPPSTIPFISSVCHHLKFSLTTANAGSQTLQN
jgi:hypothetical protein